VTKVIGKIPAFTFRQRRFIEEYLIDLNSRQAAIRAGYSARTAAAAGARLLSHVNIRQAIAARQKRQLDRAELSATRVLEELRRLAFIDMQSFFHPDGSCKKPSELTPEQGACIGSFEVLIKNAAAGDGVTDLVHRFKLWDKTRALEMLAKHYALLTDVMRVEQQSSLEQRLLAGRLRVAAARKAREGG
jgi:phage terminase small subunit